MSKTQLRILVEAPRQGSHRRVRCICLNCGNDNVIVRRDRLLRDQKPRSCGCLHSSEGLRDTPTYRSWKNMRERCNNPQATGYKYWGGGGRGIKVDSRWDSFQSFLADMGERPEGMTLDRKDNDGHYTPKNCRWTTPTTQRKNQRPRSVAE